MWVTFFLGMAAGFAGYSPAQSTQQNSEAKIISAQEFLLPAAAVTAGVDGKIVVGVTVSKTGAAERIEILARPAWPCGSDPKIELEEVANSRKQNVASTRFSPAIKDKKAVGSDLILTFKLGKVYDRAVRQNNVEEAIKKGTVTQHVISGGILNGKALKIPAADYPATARQQKIIGTVPVEVVINEQGTVILAGAISGPSVLQPKARDAACRAVFSPTLFNGQPVKVGGVISYGFYLHPRRFPLNY